MGHPRRGDGQGRQALSSPVQGLDLRVICPARAWLGAGGWLPGMEPSCLLGSEHAGAEGYGAGWGLAAGRILP
jgi:hypothetical protein